MSWYLKIIVSLSFIESLAQCFAGELDGPSKTATGKSTVSVVIPKIIKTTHTKDFSFNSNNTENFLEKASVLNISSNVRRGEFKYQVTAFSSEEKFSVNSSSGSSIPYQVFFNDSADLNGRTSLYLGKTLHAQSSSSQLNNSKGNANLSVKVDSQYFQRAKPGIYSGVLSLIIAAV